MLLAVLAHGVCRREVLAVCLLVVALAPAWGTELPQQKYYVEVRLDSPHTLRRLAADGFDVAGDNRDENIAGVFATETELRRLRALGYEYSIRAKLPMGRAALALGQYTDPLEMDSFINQIVATYPNLAKKVLLEGTLFEGQKQWAVHITKDVGQPNDRPRFMLDAQHHAREVMTSEIARDMIEYLTQRYATDPLVRRWLDNIDIWVIPMVNPDGVNHVFTSDSSWRKNRHPGCAVDLNRNYPVAWGSCNGSSGDCSATNFRGTGPLSEPEARGVYNLTNDVRPFYALSYHSFGEYIMYSYGCSDPDERAALDALAQELNSRLVRDNGSPGGWSTGPIHSTIYPSDGDSLDAQYGHYGAIGFVIEVNSTSAQPDYNTYRNITVQRQRVAWQFFLDKTLDGQQIRGRVTDTATGAPLAATVALAEVTYTHGEYPRTADIRGVYHLLTERNRTYHLVVSMPGYCSETRTVNVGSGPATEDVALYRVPVPASVSAAPSGPNRINVTWSPVQSATEYRVYRSLTVGGPWTQAGTVPSTQTTFADVGISGGVTWHYIVRAYEGCESTNSNVAAAITTGACTVAPAFGGVVSATDAGSTTCTVGLDWVAASPWCAGPVTYRVYRSTNASFTPSPATLVAAGLTGLHFDDRAALPSGVRHHYVVRAADGTSGAEDGNTATVSAIPTGPRTSGVWTDDAGDTGIASLEGDTPWSVQMTGGNGGPRVYATGIYSNNFCGALYTPVLGLQSGAVLTFASKYDIQTDLDAGIVEVATGPSYTNWTKLTTVNYPDPLRFVGNSCSIAFGGLGTAFSRSMTPAYAAGGYSGSLSAYAGQEVKLRFRFGTDVSGTGQGWWIDDVRVTNTFFPGVCASGAVPTPKEISPNVPLTAARDGASIVVHFKPACGALDSAAFWGLGRITGAPTWTGAACGLGTSGVASFDPGPTLPGNLLYFVLVGQRGAVEGSYGRSSAGAERPEAVGVGACDGAQDLGGACP